MSMIETIKKEQPEMFELMQTLAMIIVLSENIGKKEEAKNARYLFDCCIEELEKQNIRLLK